MKIGLVLEHFDPRRGGLEQWCWQFTQALIARDHQVHVISKDFCKEAEAMPVCCHRLPQGLPRLGFAQVAEETLRRLDLDIIHDTGAGWFCDVFQPHWGSWSVLTKQKLLLLPRWLRPWKRMFIRWLPRYRDIRQLVQRQYCNDGRLFLALSERVAQDFQYVHHVQRQHIRVVYNGVNLQRFCPENRERFRAEIRRQFGVDDQTLLVLIVAHNFRLKGVPTLVEAVRRLAQRGVRVHLLVIGGKRRGPPRGLTFTRDAAAVTTFVGPVEDTAPYYAAADVYVHPTLYDTFSLVVLEAMASGLPVVTSQFNGVRELLQPGVEGYLLENPLDPEEIIAKVQLLGDPKIQQQMGAAARRLAEQHPFENNVEQILSAYEEAFDRNIRGRPRVRRGHHLSPFCWSKSPLPGEGEKTFFAGPTPSGDSGCTSDW